MFEPPLSPAFLVDRLKGVRSAPGTEQIPVVELDRPENVERAKWWLIHRAPIAQQGARGDDTTVQVAARVKDYGVSQEKCLELMMNHWNEAKANPMWDYEDLAIKVANAYAHCDQNAPGSRSAHADFVPVELSEAAKAKPWLRPTLVKPFNSAQLPAREWVVQGLLAKGVIAGLVSPGGMGKTQLVLSTALGVVTGRGDILGMPIRERTSFWYWNQEDDYVELQRRLGAAMLHFGVDWNSLSGAGAPKLFLNSGVEQSLTLAKRTTDSRSIKESETVREIIEQIRAERIGVFAFDPLVEFHEANENDNGEMRAVLAGVRRIAVEGNCAVLAVAHTRKPSQAAADGFAGDVDSLRGAGSQGNLMRIVSTLYGMSPSQAKKWGVPDKDRNLYVRLDCAKTNMGLLDGKPRWFKRHGVAVGLEAETVGVLAPVQLQEKGNSLEALNVAAHWLADPGAGFARGEYFSLAQIVAKMPEAAAAIFGTPDHYARTVRKALDAAGRRPDENPFTVPTDHGLLTVSTKRGKAGIQFRLASDE